MDKIEEKQTFKMNIELELTMNHCYYMRQHIADGTHGDHKFQYGANVADGSPTLNYRNWMGVIGTQALVQQMLSAMDKVIEEKGLG